MPGSIDWEKCKMWDPSNTDGLERYWLSEGDIVMALDRPWISTGFKMRILDSEDVPSLLVQRTARIRSQEMNQKFLFHLFNHGAFKRHAVPTVTTVPHISVKDILSFKLICPPRKKQDEFAATLESITVQRNRVKLTAKKSNKVFNALLQKAFKGELT